jgi:chaperonin GroES
VSAPPAGNKGNKKKDGGAAVSKSAAPSAPSAARGHGTVNVRPLRDRVLVKRVDEGEQKVGGIIVPDSAKEKPQRASVVAVGSGRTLENGTRVPLTVKAGDTVLVGKWSGTEVKIDGTEYLIIKEDEILGIEG